MQVLDSSGKAVAALPSASTAAPSLLTDPARNLLYLPANGGSLIIAQDAATRQPTEPMTPGTAILLARAALPNYLPDTNQNPPFLDTETFWPGAATPSRQRRQRHAPLGLLDSLLRSRLDWPLLRQRHHERHRLCTASPTAIKWPSPSPGSRLFQRSHTWTLDVAPDGSVSYVSDSGDALP